MAKIARQKDLKDSIAVLEQLVKELKVIDASEPADSNYDLYNWMLAGNMSKLQDNITTFIEEKLPPIDPQTVECVANHLEGWVIGKELGRGVTGVVYTLTPGSDSKEQRVLKVSPILKSEKASPPEDITYASAAGRLGFGPLVYDSFICPVQDRAEYSAILYIVSQRLSGPTLFEMKPRDPKYLKEGLTLYYNLLANTGIAQSDFHPGNLMFEGDKLYLIDYAESKSMDVTDRKAIWEHLVEQANLFIDHVIMSARELTPVERKVLRATYWVTAEEWFNTLKASWEVSA